MKYYEDPPRKVWFYNGPAYDFWGKFLGPVQYETTASSRRQAVNNFNWRLRQDFKDIRADHIDPDRVVERP